MKKHHNPKKKRKIFSLKNIIKTIIVVVVIFFVLGIFLNNQGEPTEDEAALEDTPLEEVREQASDAFLQNDESVDAADIEVGLG